MRPSCYDCKFKGLPKQSDITLADFWGIEKINPKLDNNQGTSMVLVNSQKGEKLFDNIKANIEYEQIISEKIFKQNVCNTYSPKMTDERKKVFANIDKLTYSELNNKFFPSPSRRERVKIMLKENRLAFKIRKKLIWKK